MGTSMNELEVRAVKFRLTKGPFRVDIGSLW